MLLFAGCSKSAAPSTSSTAAPISLPALSAWQQGDKTAAVTRFLQTDWTAGPLFAPDSTLSLTESQFQSLSNAERQKKSGEMLTQLDAFKHLAAEVAKAGSDAATKNDLPQARKCCASLKQCGTALNSPQNLKLTQLVGQALVKRADAELAKIP